MRAAVMICLRNERGGILAISALMMPVFLLLVALVLDTGVWFTHKRSLQNRADAGALAAGVAYLSQLSRCQDPATAADAASQITDAAKQYGGATGAPDAYNQTPSTQGRTTVVVNADPSQPLADNTDGNPCQTHSGDSISPAGGVWTDVIAQESDLRTLAGSFGVNLDSITARARVEVNQITGLSRGGLPFVHETGDYVDCAWAEFVDVASGDRVSLVGSSNPVALTKDPSVPRRWTANVGGINLPAGATAVGVNYWMGSATNGSCDFSTDLKRKLPGDNNGDPASIDWINVFDDDTPVSGAPPRLHHFFLNPGSCGPDRVGYIYSSSPCTIGFSAQVDHGPNPAPSKVTVTSSNGWCKTNCVAPADATASGSVGTETSYPGQITYNPTATGGSTTISQDYSQVGPQEITVSWTMTSGSLTSGKSNGTACTAKKPCVCTTGAPCGGPFETDLDIGGVSDVVHQAYIADPVNSSPLYYAELLSGSSTLPNSIASDGGPVGPFKVVLVNNGVDQEHIVLIRKAVQGSGNRTLAINCGQGKGGGLDSAIENGCPKQMVVNTRGDSCDPAQDPNLNGAWDCVGTVSGNKVGIVAKGTSARFASPCTTNNWVNGSSPDNLNPSDPRFAYIFLTSFGQTEDKHGWFPVKAFLRVYVTGGDGMNCPGDDKPPRGYNGKGEQLWGHLIDFVTLSDDVITGDKPCDLKVAIVNCKPSLVR
jgi:Flp pilus assembly protein TadG